MFKSFKPKLVGSSMLQAASCGRGFSLASSLTGVAAFLFMSIGVARPAMAGEYIYISTSDQGVKKYIANVRCASGPTVKVAKACIFDDLLVEPNGRRNDMKMILICDTYVFSPYGRPDLGQVAQPGSLMAIAASRMC